MSIWSQTLVKNEERYIWYSVMSVVNYVDKMLIWDMGSEDNTFRILEDIKSKFPDKIELEKCGRNSDYTKLRQQMLEMTKSDWFLILDGDEVWWNDSLNKIISKIDKRKDKLDTIVTPYYNLVGDIYHYQPELAGRYKIDGRIGHITIRFMNRRIPGLYTKNPHGQHGYFDIEDLLIQERTAKRRIYMSSPFMHFTHLIRSKNRSLDEKVQKRKNKYKVEMGNEFPRDFYYPEVFFEKRPDVVASVWGKMSNLFGVKASILTLPLKFKRKLFTGGSGY